MTKQEREKMPLDKQIKNLQVSISIARKEIKTNCELIPTKSASEKNKLIARIAVCEKIIAQKEMELIPLKEQWDKIKPARSTNTTVTDDEINSIKLKYGF